MSRRNLLLLAALAPFVLLGFGCSVNISGGSRAHEFGVATGGGERGAAGLQMEIPKWDAVVGDSSPIRGSWTSSAQALRDLQEHPDRPVQWQFQSRQGQGRAFEYSTYLRNGRAFHIENEPGRGQTGPIRMEGRFSTARLLFSGEQRNKQAGGECEIIPDEHFLRRGGELLTGELTVGELLRFGMQPDPLEYIELVSANGNRWTWSEVLHLQQRGLKPEFILALRKRPVAPDDRRIEPAPERAEPRKPFSAEELVLLHSRGVSVDYVEKLNASGSAFSANEIVLLHSRGVTTEFVEALAGVGLHTDANGAVLLFGRGVSARYIREIRGFGYDFGPNDLVLLHARGVPATFARELREAGYSFTSNDLVLLHSRGVPAHYASTIANRHYEPLAAHEIVRLYSSGVPAETVKRLRK